MVFLNESKRIKGVEMEGKSECESGGGKKIKHREGKNND